MVKRAKIVCKTLFAEVVFLFLDLSRVLAASRADIRRAPSISEKRAQEKVEPAAVAFDDEAALFDDISADASSKSSSSSPTTTTKIESTTTTTNSPLDSLIPANM